MEQKTKKTIFSGIQPSGILTIGNYLGALRNWVELQDDYNCYYCVVDLHAITVHQNPTELKKRCLELLALYIACGLDPEKNTMYFQSHVSAHAELGWLLTCASYMGELSRMTQYKDKSAKQGANIGAGLLVYPTLMAADILLYNADLVPIGNDQKQHLELTRDLAIRFNNAYGETFVVPEAFMGKTGARIMSLQDPSKKMSKSDENTNAFISMLDPEDVIMRKCKRAVTDSENRILYSDEQKGVKNLIEIYAACRNITPQQVEHEFAGVGYGQFKEAVGTAVSETIMPIQKRQQELLKDKAYLQQVFTEGAKKAEYVANRTLWKAQKRLGLAPKKL
ncbi:MAG: tryptophan--tRNA ligase [Clostridiales bacterium]|nr:tryptophan--tRNA ligase [Clostridiales bacterium]